MLAISKQYIIEFREEEGWNKNIATKQKNIKQIGDNITVVEQRFSTCSGSHQNSRKTVREKFLLMT